MNLNSGLVTSHFCKYVSQVALRFNEEGKISSNSQVIQVQGVSGLFDCVVKKTTIHLKIQNLVEHFFQERSKEQNNNSNKIIEEYKAQIKKQLSHSAQNTMVRVMMCDALRQNGILLSCEEVVFSNGKTKEDDSIEVKLTESAEISTQGVRSHLKPFIGPIEELTELRQREMAITHAKSSKPVIATWHVENCYTLIGFSLKCKVGFMVHIDIETSFFTALKNIQRQCANIWKLDSIEFEVRIIGGADIDNQKGPGYHLNRIVKALVSYSTNQCSFILTQIPASDDFICFEDVCKDSFWSQSVRLSRSIALDTRASSFDDALYSYEPYAYAESRVNTSENEKFLKEVIGLRKAYIEKSAP